MSKEKSVKNLKNSFQNFVKRFSACFVAVVVMGYSLLFCAVPGRGVVHADSSNLFNIAVDTFYNIGSEFLEGVGVLPLPGASYVSYAGQNTLDLAYNIFRGGGIIDSSLPIAQDFLNLGDFNEINISTASGITGYYERNGKTHSISVYTRSNSININETPYIPIIEGEDYAFYLELLPLDGKGKEDYTFSFSDYFSSGSIRREVNSGNKYFNIRCYLWSDGDYITREFYNVTGFTMYINSTGAQSASEIILPDNISDLFNYFNLRVYSSRLTNYGQPRVICSSNNSSTFSSSSLPSYRDTVINQSNVYDYYNNSVYPYYSNKYSTYNFSENVYSPSYYYENLPEQTEPSQDATEPTGTGAVIIIDPFTLPPEWVESDVVQFNTEAYTIDYDTMIDEPLDEINYPLTPTNPLRGGANILSFGIQFLKDGGVFYIICTLLVIGLLIRFLGI